MQSKKYKLELEGNEVISILSSIKYDIEAVEQSILLDNKIIRDCRKDKRKDTVYIYNRVMQEKLIKQHRKQFLKKLYKKINDTLSIDKIKK